jgi:hypothetical protein
LAQGAHVDHSGVRAGRHAVVQDFSPGLMANGGWRTRDN